MDRESRAVWVAAWGAIMAARVRVRAISNEEGNRLLGIVRRSSGSVVTWRRAQMVLLSAQGMDAARIAEITFTSPDRVRDVIHNFNADGFDALYPRYRGGRPPTFTLPERQQIKRIALSRPADHDLPFSTWSLAKLADFLVAEGVVEDISHAGLRALLGDEGVSFQRLKTFKESNDPDFERKQARVLELYAIADGHAEPGPEDPAVVICLDEFGPAPGGTGDARRTRARTACGTCSPPTTSPAIGSTATSRRARVAPSSSPSAATSARAIRPRCAWRSCSTTSART
jgi:transposase